MLYKKKTNAYYISVLAVSWSKKKEKVFVGKRIDNPENFWQMPQGGVDNNEKFSDAALRELNEETSIKSVKIIKEIKIIF